MDIMIAMNLVDEMIQKSAADYDVQSGYYAPGWPLCWLVSRA